MAPLEERIWWPAGWSRTIDLLQWSSCIEAGAIVLSGLSSNVALARTSQLSSPEWVPEVGFAPSSEPVLAQVGLGPSKRLSAMMQISRQLLLQASPGVDQYLINGLSRALSNQLDRIALIGAPPGNTPIGILGNPGTHKEIYDWDQPDYGALTEFERLVEVEDVGIGSFGYIMHPDGKKILRDTARFGAKSGGNSIWESLTRPLSSMTVQTPTDIFFGQWSLMVVGVWGDAADIVIDNFTRAQDAVVQIIASLYCDVAITLPAAFGIARQGVPRLARPTGAGREPYKLVTTNPEPAPLPPPPPVSLHAEPAPPPKAVSEPEERNKKFKPFR